MAQAIINLRMDADLKRRMEDVCKSMGMNLPTAFTIFANKVAHERRIPFEVSAPDDPFYSEENQAALRSRISDIEAGRNVSVHELIEA